MNMADIPINDIIIWRSQTKTHPVVGISSHLLLFATVQEGLSPGQLTEDS